MEEKKIIQYKVELNLNGLIIPCYVLNDGTRVLSGRGMQEALKMVDDNKTTSGHRIVRYLNQKTLSPFISKYLELDHFSPILCYEGGKKINGYRAEVLADICDVFANLNQKLWEQKSFPFLLPLLQDFGV